MVDLARKVIGSEEMREVVSGEGRSGEEKYCGLFRGLGRPSD
jgi:hypothetical protein